MLLVGLTGGIGAGKSTVAEMLRSRGAVVLDADVVARRVVEPGTPGLAALVGRFGDGVVDEYGRLDRAALATVAFADAGSRQDLEAITHPAIQAEFAREIAAAPSDAIVVCDVPLLAESPEAAARGYAAVIVVEAPRTLRLARLEARGLDRRDAEARMDAQASDAERRALATHVLDNGGSLDDLGRQVEAVWADLEARHRAQR